MIRLAITVEGRTEEEFINVVLQPHLFGIGVNATPIIIGKGRGGRGGNITRDRIASELSLLLYSFDAVTTLVDYYGFGDRGNVSVGNLETEIMDLTLERIRGNANHAKLLPYVQIHEFEGLLFSDVSVFNELSNITNEGLRELQEVRNRFQTPEDINDGPNTAPSKRIAHAIPRYEKVVDGPLLADSIGLCRIRQECPRFEHWISKIERLPERITS